MPATMPFRLRCLRGPVALSAEIKPSHRSRRPETFSNIVNLSGSGCLLQTEESYAEGDRVSVRFALPGMTEVQTEGRVARVGTGEGSRDFLVAVAFDAVAERDSEMIVRHIIHEDRRRRAV